MHCMQPGNREEAALWVGDAREGEPGGAAICHRAIRRDLLQGAQAPEEVVPQDPPHPPHSQGMTKRSDSL